MTQRRRFFPSTTVQTVPGRTVELEVQVRRSAPEAPIVEPQVCPVPVMEPPVWFGWQDKDGNRAVDLTRKSEHLLDGVGQIFRPALFVAVVDGAQYVHWDISFTPVLWRYGYNKGQWYEDELWRGDPIETTLQSEDFEADPYDLGYELKIELPQVDGAAPQDYWPMVTWSYGWEPNDFAYLPLYIAAGNTLSISLFDPAAAMSGELTAVAKTIEDVEIGRVTLRLMVPCDH